MGAVVVHGRCGGAWEMMWCIDVVVHRYGGVWEMWWFVVDVVVLELPGMYGSCGGAWKMWWCMGDVVVHRRCNAHGLVWCIMRCVVYRWGAVVWDLVYGGAWRIYASENAFTVNM
jgi:hypothetical protein